MNKKTKVKIILFVILAIIGLVAGFFLTGFINLVLSGGYSDIHQLHPAAILESLAANGRHRMLTLCVELVIVSGIAVVLLMSRRETFESDVRAVTQSINTPIAIGQGQHGRKRNAYPTGLTQNVEYLLDSITARTMLSNSEFIVMNNQAASDRAELAKLLNISAEQLDYVTNAEAGCGLMRIGNAIVPFINKFSTNTALYRLMTTKPFEKLS